MEYNTAVKKERTSDTYHNISGSENSDAEGTQKSTYSETIYIQL